MNKNKNKTIHQSNKQKNPPRQEFLDIFSLHY